MPVVLDPHASIGVAKEKGVVDRVSGIGWVGIPAPFEIAKGSPVKPVVAAAVVTGQECFLHKVWQHRHDAVRATMGSGGVQGRLDIFRFHRVHDRIVHQDDIELSPEPEGAHVTLKMLGARIDASAYRQHVGRKVRQREIVQTREMRRQAASTGAELEQRRSEGSDPNRGNRSAASGG